MDKLYEKMKKKKSIFYNENKTIYKKLYSFWILIYRSLTLFNKINNNGYE